MKCLYKEQNNLPPCVSIYNRKWGYLKDFLLNNFKDKQYFSIVHKIQCLQVKNGHIEIEQSRCIKCLFCVLNCPGNLISIKKDFALQEKCDEFNGKIEVEEKIVKNFFNGEMVEIPYLHNLSTKSKYKTLENFTEVEETQNIAVWAASLIKYLSNDQQARLGLEIKMIIKSRDRGGRLDICLLTNDKSLFAIETKVSFKKMMSENRYLSQMISYKEEIKKNLDDLHLTNIKDHTFLLIDGKETDLLYPNHKMCTAKIGNQAEIFYKNLIEHNLFFVSATALWALSLKKLLINRDKYSLENFFNKIIPNKHYGLVSAGIITKTSSGFIIQSLDSFLE